VELYELLGIAAILVSIAGSAASLGYWLSSRFRDIDLRFRDIESRLSRLESRLGRLEHSIHTYNELLLKVLEAKGVITGVEALAFIYAIKAITPATSSKYYTEEVRERLLQLLSKDPNEYTLEDVRELNRIADLIFMEYEETRREELLEYQAKLRVAAQLIKIVFVEPKIMRGEQVLKPGAPVEKKG